VLVFPAALPPSSYQSLSAGNPKDVKFAFVAETVVALIVPPVIAIAFESCLPNESPISTGLFEALPIQTLESVRFIASSPGSRVPALGAAEAVVDVFIFILGIIFYLYS
jgi:hypothetical protein